MPELARSDNTGDEVSTVGALLDLLTSRPSWHARAACKSAPLSVSWFPEKLAPAPKAICAGCPVREDCLAWALEQGPDLAGIWGGTSPRERDRIRTGGCVTATHQN